MPVRDTQRCFRASMLDTSPKNVPTGQVGPMKVMKFGKSGIANPRYDSGQIFHLSWKNTRLALTSVMPGWIAHL